MYLNC